MYEYKMSLAEFGNTPIRDLIMLYEDLERIEANKTLNAVFIGAAARNPSSDRMRHTLSDLRETAMGDDYDVRRKSNPELSKEEYFRRMEAMGHKAIEV